MVEPMKRRSKVSDQRATSRSLKAAKRKRSSASDKAPSSASPHASAEADLARLTHELTDERRQRVATSEVLRLLSGSHGDLNHLFDTILANATNLCQPNFGTLSLCEGDAFRIVAMHNAPPGLAELRRREPLVRAGPLLRMAEIKRLLHIADYTEYVASHPADSDAAAFAKLTGVRTILEVPMLKDGEVVGAIVIYRQEVRTFSDREIELLKNFAAQAVIAIENARLLNELRQRTTDLTERTADLTEALEQQTATSEVLQVISGSPGELQPVFETMLEKAVHICDAKFGSLYLHEDGRLRLVAGNDVPQFLEARRGISFEPAPGALLDQIMRSKQAGQIADLALTKPYMERHPGVVEAVELAGIRSAMAVPMLREDELIGVLAIHRREVLPFTEKQIALLTNFAAQAVIAIENARLLNELRQRTDDLTERTTELTEALEQQTATSEVLQVISGSPGNLQPVFASMLENAVRICDATFGNIYRWEGEALHHLAAHNTPPAFAEARKRSPRHPAPNTPAGRAVATRTVVHVTDLAAEQAYIEQRDPATVAPVELGGVRTFVSVPMLKENELIGTFALARQEVRPFTDKQIELVTNFAAQAVIAIENARLLNELRQRTSDLTESLEQQTATSEVLQVISSSPGDLQPVFATMLERAVRICDASFGNIYSLHGDEFRLSAAYKTPPAFAEYRKRSPIMRTSGSGLSVTTKTKNHVADLLAEEAHVDRDPAYVAAFELAGVRTYLSVPMVKEDDLIGALILSRQEVRPFTDKQIALVESFAAQAVIAIENARLLNELRDTTEQVQAQS
jgi:two-component system, NtrC family, sensor kinase